MTPCGCAPDPGVHSQLAAPFPPFKLVLDMSQTKAKIPRINFGTLIIERRNPNLLNELIIGHRGILIMKYF